MAFLKEWLNGLPPEVVALLGYSRLAGAALILLVGLIAARLVQTVVKNLFLRLAARTKSHLDEALLKIVQRPLWQTVFLISASMAIVWLGPGPRAEFYLIGVVESAILLFWLIAFLRITTLVFAEIGLHLTRTGRPGADLLPLLANVIRVLLIGGGIMGGLTIWEIDITPLLASAGIAGVAVALAAKDTLANFFGGVSVFMDRPYKIGDFINLDSGERGEVVDIGIRSTRLQTRDDIQIIIPNATIASSKIVNESAPMPRFRIRLKISVAYGSDLDLVEKVLLETAADDEMVLVFPEPRVRLRSFGDSGIDFELLGWLNHPRDRGAALHEIGKEVYKRFNQNGIVIPFPQLDVHWKGEG